MDVETFPEIHAAAREFPSVRWDHGRVVARGEAVADEVPVALVYNGISHAVMLASPSDLEDFGIGFSLSESIVSRVGDIREVAVASIPGGIAVNLTISTEAFAKLKERRRNLAGRTGCGLCGTESIDQVFRSLPDVARGYRIDVDALHRATEQLGDLQPLHARTGAIHAAAWGRADGGLGLVREDVGRHNALDKLIGAMARHATSFDSGFALLTSRASSEMVQKVATMGISLVAAISAPTGLAIEIAQRTGVTLLGFVRDGRHTVYTHAERLVGQCTGGAR